MVRGVARGVQRPEGDAGVVQLESFAHVTGGNETVAGREAEHLRSGALRQAGRTRRMVGMRMGDDDPSDTARTEVGQGVEMTVVVGAGIDHGQQAVVPTR